MYKAIKLVDVPPNSKFISTTWAMKRKSNGVRRARLAMRGFEQVKDTHYDPESTAAPVTNDVTIRIIMTLALMAGWVGHIVDVKGAFLHGEFENEEKKISPRFQKDWNIIMIQKYGVGC